MSSVDVLRTLFALQSLKQMRKMKIKKWEKKEKKLLKLKISYSVASERLENGAKKKKTGCEWCEIIEEEEKVGGRENEKIINEVSKEEE